MKVLSECVFLIGGFYDDWLAFMSLNPKAASTTYVAKISQKEPSQNSLILTPPDLGIFLTLRAFYFLGNFSCLNFYIQGYWSRLIDVIWGRREDSYDWVADWSAFQNCHISINPISNLSFPSKSSFPPSSYYFWEFYFFSVAFIHFQYVSRCI